MMTCEDARHAAYHLGHQLGDWLPGRLPDVAYAVCAHPGCAAFLLAHVKDGSAVGPARDRVCDGRRTAMPQPRGAG